METNPKFWDCECPKNFIHLKELGKFCPECQTHAEEQPDSRQVEVVSRYKVENDKHIK